jgi:predicted dehydrogenase|tara:strand:- start:201 stop:1190 length:990 start_codon:yes stop_codon:yes gene_type:complete
LSTTKVKWGIIGCGNIANTFAKDLALIESAELTAVASRTFDKATLFGRNHRTKKFYGSYEQLLKDDEIDIVYIATPHVSHAELSIKAMENGKHVLCEKPLGLSVNEARKMIETSKRTNRFFMEALWTRFNPVFVEVLKRIKNNEIGEVNYINADFAFKSNHSLESRVYNLALGGGAILDIGIYPTFLTYAILGIPQKITASSILHEETGADIQTSMVFDYKNSQAVLYCGFTSNSKMIAKISGTNGEIHIHSRWHEAEEFSIIRNGLKVTFKVSKIGKGYTHEIEECHKCLAANKTESNLWSHQNSIDLITILDTIRNQVGLKYPQENS